MDPSGSSPLSGKIRADGQANIVVEDVYSAVANLREINMSRGKAWLVGSSGIFGVHALPGYYGQAIFFY